MKLKDLTTLLMHGGSRKLWMFLVSRGKGVISRVSSFKNLFLPLYRSRRIPSYVPLSSVFFINVIKSDCARTDISTYIP